MLSSFAFARDSWHRPPSAMAGRDGIHSHESAAHLPAVALALAAVFLASCASADRGFSAARTERYLQDHGELAPAVRKSMERGHVLMGMDLEQVQAVLGDPVQKKSFPGRSPVESWLYPAARLHQGHYRYSGGTLLRLVFIDGRLSLLEPI